ncbi:MAG: hypothetical protein NZ891_04485, partial [bacterium]|nr:hypothetical protein [bacterium]MDW8163981.1 proton-conducting transporter membrane subunit [Candidatus Omnitrophota bacterium]
MLMLILFLPFIGVVLGKIFPKKFFIFIASLIAFIEVLLTAYLPLLIDETNKTIFELGDILFLCDEIGLIFAIISSFIAFLIFIYSFGYFKEEEKDYFSFWGLIFLGSMLGVIFSDNLISLYFFWEVAGLSSYRLIGFYREKDHLLKADKAFMITTSGAGIM